jgi:hypothetical protein
MLSCELGVGDELFEAIEIVSVVRAESLSLSATPNWIEFSPVALGEPEITPVVELSCRPDGKLPETKLQV